MLPLLLSVFQLELSVEHSTVFTPARLSFPAIVTGIWVVLYQSTLLIVCLRPVPTVPIAFVVTLGAVLSNITVRLSVDSRPAASLTEIVYEYVPSAREAVSIVCDHEPAVTVGL